MEPKTDDWESYAADFPQIDNDTTIGPLLCAALALVPGRRLIDVGCGEGALLDLIKAHDPTWQTSGFEISHLRGERARARGHEVVVSDDGVVPLKDGSADVVTSTHVVEHVPDDAHYVRELARLASPGGVVYIETPLRLPGAWYFRRNSEAGWVLDPTHVREYRSVAEVIRLVEDAGLRPVATGSSRISYPVAAAEQIARRALGRPQRTERPTGWRAGRISIPRYRQLEVLAQKPSA